MLWDNYSSLSCEGNVCTRHNWKQNAEGRYGEYAQVSVKASPRGLIEATNWH